MAHGFRYVEEPGFEAQILRSSSMRDLLRGLGEQVLAHAESSAAFRKGYLREGITLEVGINAGRGDGGRFVAGDRYTARVVSHDFKTVWLEYGTRRTRAQPFLVPALVAVLPGATIARR